ncbi:MAG: hypothetical protein R3E86_22460, partial [Pseudomonadales bacterium]
ALLNVIEDLADEFWIGDVRDDPQLLAADRAEGYIDFEKALQSLLDSVDGRARVAGAAADSSRFLRRRAPGG